MRTIAIHASTQQGPVRMANEDHILVGRFIKNRGQMSITLDYDDDFLAAFGFLLAVADGIGGEAGGALASRIALSALEKSFYSTEKTGIGQCEERLREAAMQANTEILSLAVTYPEYARMGCTLTGVCLTSWGFLVFHAGDSRVYRCRNGVLKQLTSDETVAAALLAAGEISYAQAELSNQRHTLINCAGSTSFMITIANGPDLKDEDILLVCSDGLHDLVPYESLGEIFSESMDVAILNKRLVDDAIRRGGHDNISLILIQLKSVDVVEKKETIDRVETTSAQVLSMDSGDTAPTTETENKGDVI